MTTIIGNEGASVTLRILRGVDRSVTVFVTDDGEVYDLTGFTASCVVRTSAKSTASLMTVTPTINTVLGSITLPFVAATTAAATWENAKFWLNITSAGGTVTRLIDGDLILSYLSSGETETSEVTVETANGLTLNIVPFDAETDATHLQGVAISATDPTVGQFLRATSASAASWQTLTFAMVTALPTTLLGYGITDAATSAALASEIATRAADDLTLSGIISTHAARTDNPHAVTAAQVGSYTIAAANAAFAPVSHAHAATDLTSGTLPDARFPATLPAVSGVNLTALNASNLGSGNVPYARMATGSGSWDVGAGNTLTLTRDVTMSAALNVAGLATFSRSVNPGAAVAVQGISPFGVIVSATASAQPASFVGLSGASEIRFSNTTGLTLRSYSSWAGDFNPSGGAVRFAIDSSGNIAWAGDLAINANKFTVAASSGNTVVAGTLGLTGIATLATYILYNGTTLARDARDNNVWTQDASGVASNRTMTIGNGTYSNIVFSSAVAGGITASNITGTGNLAITGTSTLTGNVGIGGASKTTAGLAIQSAALTGASQTGIENAPAFTSAAITAGFATYSRVRLADASFTMVSGYGVYIDNAQKLGAGAATLTTNYGLYVNGMTTGSANYAIYTNAGQVRIGDTLLVVNGATLQSTLDVTGAAIFASTVQATAYKVGVNQVVGARKTGWTVATGTATRTAFDTATVTLPQLAQAVKALIDDLHATAGHGLIGT